MIVQCQPVKDNQGKEQYDGWKDKLTYYMTNGWTILLYDCIYIIWLITFKDWHTNILMYLQNNIIIKWQTKWTEVINLKRQSDW